MLDAIIKECTILQTLEQSALVIKHLGHFQDGNYFYLLTELAVHGDLKKQIDVRNFFKIVLFILFHNLLL